jgi:hypothetical protein
MSFDVSVDFDEDCVDIALALASTSLRYFVLIPDPPLKSRDFFLRIPDHS